MPPIPDSMLSRILHRLSFGRGRDPDAPERRIYGALVTQARRPRFYLEGGVPDTLDGRYELVVLHVVLVLRRLKRAGPEAEALARRIQEVMVEDFDRCLREMSIGDSGVAKRVKAMLKGFAGRLGVYSAGLESADDGGLDVAFDNNLYGTVSQVPAAARAALIAYTRAQAAALAGRPLEALLAGNVEFTEDGMTGPKGDEHG